jgi:hypothetical protein
MFTTAGGSGLMMEGRWRTLPAAFYAAFDQVLNEVYDKVIFSLGLWNNPPPFHSVQVKCGLLFSRPHCFKKHKKLFPQSSEQPGTGYFNLF